MPYTCAATLFAPSSYYFCASVHMSDPAASAPRHSTPPIPLVPLSGHTTLSTPDRLPYYYWNPKRQLSLLFPPVLTDLASYYSSLPHVPISPSHIRASNLPPSCDHPSHTLCGVVRRERARGRVRVESAERRAQGESKGQESDERQQKMPRRHL